MNLAALPPPFVTTPRALLLPARACAAGDYAAFHVENDPHLLPWSPPRWPGYQTTEGWRAWLERAEEEEARGVSLRLGLWVPEGETASLAGTIHLTAITRGPLQSANLGYALGARWEGQGRMREALAAVIPAVFTQLRLHRIEASYVPHNSRSGALLRHLGFVVEGYSRDFLYVGGAWQDHIRTAILNPAWAPE